MHEFKSKHDTYNCNGKNTVNDLERQLGKQTQTSNFVWQRRSSLNALDNTQNEMVPKMLKNMTMRIAINLVQLLWSLMSAEARND